jgi:thymidylate synthase (FAD)
MSEEKFARPNSPFLDALIESNTQTKVLDRGMIRVVDYMGNDSAIVQAARVSYGAGTKTIKDDDGLIRYLMRHRHSTPFEMCELKIHVKMPIFVARQWVRHRTANINEYSGRYSEMSPDFYTPNTRDVLAQSTTNKQGRDGKLHPTTATNAALLISDANEAAYRVYQQLLGKADGPNDLLPIDEPIARELARLVLPVSNYTEWYWKCDLKNILHFLSLRDDKHAQPEIQAYAKALDQIVSLWVPVAHRAYRDYLRDATSLSGIETKIIQMGFAGERIKKSDHKLSKSEWSELTAKFPAIAKLIDE